MKRAPHFPLAGQSTGANLTSRRAALARAQRAAADLAAAAEQARLAAMNPVEFAAELQNRSALARIETNQLARDVQRDDVERSARDALRQRIPPEAVSGLERAVADAHVRAAGFIKLGAFAAKHGVTFDVSAAIAGPVSLESARRQVGDAMAAEAEATATYSRSTSHGAAAAEVAAGWDTALKIVAERQGLKLGT